MKLNCVAEIVNTEKDGRTYRNVVITLENGEKYRIVPRFGNAVDWFEKQDLRIRLSKYEK